jgi:hypothetical protein
MLTSTMGKGYSVLFHVFVCFIVQLILVKISSNSLESTALSSLTLSIIETTVSYQKGILEFNSFDI